MSVLYYARLYEHWTQEGDISKLRVLVGCELSGIVSQAFRDLGHFAYSCDIEPTEGDRDFHIQGDVMDVLNSGYSWDVIILHPPCTALAVSGNRHYGAGQSHYDKRLTAAAWTEELWKLACKYGNHVALENPVSVLARLTDLPKAHYVQPYEHGHPESKKTGFHLHNLPPLEPTNNVYDAMMALPMKDRQRIHYMSPSPERGRMRSKTFPGIAAAMADQWGGYAMKEFNRE